MSGGLVAVLQRADYLLSHTSGIKRSVSPALRREIPRADGVDETPDEVGPTYVLRWGGDENSQQGPINVNSQGIKTAVLKIGLSIFCGGGEGGESDTPATDLTLAGLWTGVVQVLQDPNNLDRTNTLWWQTKNFTASEPRRVGDRMVLDGRCTAVFGVDYGAL